MMYVQAWLGTSWSKFNSMSYFTKVTNHKMTCGAFFGQKINNLCLIWPTCWACSVWDLALWLDSFDACTVLLFNISTFGRLKCHSSPKSSSLWKQSFAVFWHIVFLNHSQSSKREKAAAMAELYRLTSIYEDECQGLRQSIKTIESLMEERRASLPPEQTYNDGPDQTYVNTSPVTPPQTRIPRSPTLPTMVDGVPRFMSPTASSRGKKRRDAASTTKVTSPPDNK